MTPTFHSLPNGSLLVVARNPNLNSVAVFAGVHVGSRFEPKGMHGAAHFVEHIFFKGTNARPTAKKISAEIESLGGSANAYTDKEMTAFHVTVSKHDSAVGVDVIHDMLANALFRTLDIEKERPVIREEISMYDNDPDSNAWELSEAVAYAGTGLAHRITGNVEDVSFSPDNLRRFFHEWYVPARTIVVLSGAVDDKTVALAKAKFGSMIAKAVPAIYKDSTPEPKSGVDFVAGKTDRLHLVIRFPGVPNNDPRSKALSILGLALGGYSSARLFQSLREDKSLCYGVGSAHSGLSDVGSIYVSTSLDRPKFVPAVKAILREIQDVRKNGFGADEIRNAKTHYRGKKALRLDSPMSVADDIVRQCFTTGTYEKAEDRVKKVMRVRASDVSRLAKEFLNPSSMHVAVCGPKAAKKEVLSALEEFV